jgi:hypothetical protein
MELLPVGTIRAQGNVDAHGGCLVGFLRQMPPFAVSTGRRLLRLIRPSSLSTRTFSTSKCRLEQIHGADEAVCQGRTSTLFAALTVL